MRVCDLCQVRERWVNHLDERVSKTSWTQDEDKKLTEICQKYSGQYPHTLTHSLTHTHRHPNTLRHTLTP